MFKRTNAFTKADKILWARHLLAMLAAYALFFGTRYVISHLNFLLATGALLIVLLICGVLTLTALIGLFIMVGDLRYERLSAEAFATPIIVWLLTVGAAALFILAIDLAAIVKSA